MKKEYNILVQWANGRYSLLWQRDAVTQQEAQEALHTAEKGWHRKGDARKVFLCSPKRAHRLLAQSREERAAEQI